VYRPSGEGELDGVECAADSTVKHDLVAADVLELPHPQPARRHTAGPNTQTHTIAHMSTHDIIHVCTQYVCYNYSKIKSAYT